MTDDEVWEERFNTIALFPYAWIGKAQQLLYCASVIYENANPFDIEKVHVTAGVFFMLYAYAFENLLKGLILSKEKDKGRLSPNVKRLSNHNLVWLLNEAGLTGTKDEIDLLNRLEQFGVQGGRYPVPTDWKRYKILMNGTSAKRGNYSSHDPVRIISLIDKIEREYTQLGIKCDIYDYSYYLTTADGKSTYIERKIKRPHYP